MTVYYNEIDHAAVVWLEALIKEKLIPYGHVDDRDIRDVRPNDLRGFSQCHFFAGIGGWPLALRLAGLDDRRGIWTGSCPCQPFSSAGFGKGFADERHLWPFWFHLIRVCRPDLIYLEQVASSAGTQWIDLVSDDVQGEGFAIGALDFPSAGVGSPNARQRFYAAVELADAERQRRERREGRILRGQDQGARGETPEVRGGSPRTGGAVSRLAHSYGWNTCAEREQSSGQHGLVSEDRRPGASGRPGPTNGHWGTVDWIRCRDDLWRPVEPGTFPLAASVPFRVEQVRGYGNAINVEAAKAFVEAHQASRKPLSDRAREIAGIA